MIILIAILFGNRRVYQSENQTEGHTNSSNLNLSLQRNFKVRIAGAFLIALNV